ncbi:hypothetical protein BDZ94DRAFT_1256946 [Collybia nuda]|uniref:Uncharacterized protein n=1 Tax=Collybia nuda TaxID=64659 RepID=A0A9P6CKY4_9AGAR|nr:hypothetical protein BDZ94DRAFT_1256946 [Collybia nuda]
MNSVLESHHLDTKREVTKRQIFTCKIHVPPAKVLDACDVETFKEFKALAEEIIDNKPHKDITLTVEMTWVEWANTLCGRYSFFSSIISYVSCTPPINYLVKVY